MPTEYRTRATRVANRRQAGSAPIPEGPYHERMPSMRHWHRASAALLGLFVALHLLNHLAALAGVQSHIDVMQALRPFYRNALVEPLLLACAAFQAVSGLIMVIRGWRERAGRVAWLQAASGTYLAFFLVVHVGAVLAGRALLGLDTNFHFAAAGMHIWPYTLFFMPYYGLAVLALFAHLGCALYWQAGPAATHRARQRLTLALSSGAVLSLVLVATLAGLIVPVEIPAAYRASYP